MFHNICYKTLNASWRTACFSPYYNLWVLCILHYAHFPQQRRVTHSIFSLQPRQSSPQPPSCMVLPQQSAPDKLLLGAVHSIPHESKHTTHTSLALSPQHSSKAQLAFLAAGTNTTEDRRNVKDYTYSSVPSLQPVPQPRRTDTVEWEANTSKAIPRTYSLTTCFISHSSC